VQLQLLQLGFWLLVMVWTFCLVMVWILCLVLALERDTLSWLAIGFKVCFSRIILSVKVKGARGWLRAYGWVTILLYCLWKNEHISFILTQNRRFKGLDNI
jgi:hypothetical protein